MASWELSFAALLKHYRRQAGMTQEELAARANYSPSYISQLERGEKTPTAATLDLLARALELDVSETTHLRQSVHARPRTHLALPPLPLPLTSFIGRDALLDELQRQIAEPGCRLLTLVGPPGVGKTRLGLALAHRLQTHDHISAVFVSLAPLTEARLVVPTIARLFDTQTPDNITLEALIGMITSRVQRRQLLLLLDNCEHLPDALPAVATLLATCPAVRVLATSRSPLLLQGEQIFETPPLVVPPAQAPITLSEASQVHSDQEETDALRSYSGVALLLERMKAVNPRFSPSPAERDVYGAIVRRLDGLPLAIELAAARSKALTPHEILSRLDSTSLLTMLSTGVRDAPPRQRTLYNALRWSYDLLDTPTQQLFRRLSVFAGGTLAAANRVAAPTASPERFLDLMSHLVESNLIQVSEVGGERRFDLLHTVREFGETLLKERREQQRYRQLHAEYVLWWAEQLREELRLLTEHTLPHVDREIDNVRAALRWLRATNQRQVGQRIVTALSRFWDLRGYWREGELWCAAFAPVQEDPPAQWVALRCLASTLARRLGDIERAQRLAEEAEVFAQDDLLLRADALHALANAAYARGESQAAYRYDEEQVALRRQGNDLPGLAQAMMNAAGDLSLFGQREDALQLYDEALALARQAGGQELEATGLSNVCIEYAAAGDFERAREAGQAAAHLFRHMGAFSSLAHTLTNLGDIEFRAEALNAAQEYFAQSLDLSVQLGEQSSAAIAYYNLGCVAIAQGKREQALELYERAMQHYDPLSAQRLHALTLAARAETLLAHNPQAALADLRASLDISRALGLQEVIIDATETLAILLTNYGQRTDLDYAALMLGAAHKARGATSLPAPAWTQRKIERIRAELIKEIGEQEYEALFASGRQRSLDDVLDQALYEEALSTPRKCDVNSG